MKERPLYIHFEGMDLAGKTTSTQLFMEKEHQPWEVRRNSIVPENPIHKLADTLRHADAYDAEVLGNLYVAALMADLRSFKWPEVNTIQDSTILLRSLAYHTVRGTPRLREIFAEFVPYHPKFDSSFIFTASVEKRLERLEMRATHQPDQLSAEDFFVRDRTEKFLAMEKCLMDLSRKFFHSVTIDTTALTPDAVVEKISNHILVIK